jgi:ABC-type glycerol-3-phosphate transport system substrate-binding protein
MPKFVTRRNFVRGTLLGLSGALLAACQPQVVEKIVKETVMVEKPVEKVVEKEKVVKETVVVQVKEATKAPKANVSIRFHARIGEQENKLYEMQMPKFMATNPHIKVTLENFPDAEYVAKVSTMLAGGTLGDVVWSALGQAKVHFMYAQNVVRPIDDLVAAEKFDLAAYYKGGIQAMTVEGKLLGLPFKAHPGLAIIYYNENLFKAGNVPLPKADWKHEDMVTAAKAIRATAGDKPLFGVLNDTSWKSLLTNIRSFGGELISEDGKKFLLGSDQGLLSLQRYYDLFQTHKVSPTPEQLIGSAGAMWTGGMLGMYQAGTSGQVLRNTIGDKFKWMVTNNPIGPAGVGGSDFEVDCYAVTKPTKQVEAAWEWVKYLCNQDSGVLLGVIGGTIGGRIDTYNSPVLLTDPVRPIFRDIMAKAQASRIVGNWRQEECEKAIVQLLQPLWVGKEKPVKAFVDTVVKQIQDIMDKPKP